MLQPWLCCFHLKMKLKMKVLLERFAYHPEATLGKLTIEDEEFYTAERPFRGNKKNVSCIPSGKYTCSRYTSKRFGETFIVDDVPNRTYILFHVGNFPETDSQGCILIGEKIMEGRPAISMSKKAMQRFRDTLKEEDKFEFIIEDKFPFDWS